MARLDWDRLRRVRPLDDADLRVDPDGASIWDRGGDAPGFGRSRPLPPGVIRRPRRVPAPRADTETTR